MPDIFVVHGALGSAAQMKPLADALRELGNVVVVELPGHGATPLGDCAFGMDTFVEALADAIESVSYADSPDRAFTTKPIAFGYSMGGYVALALEAQRPGTLGAIVTLGTKFAWTPEVATQENARLNPRSIEEKIPKLAERHQAAGGWFDVLANTRELLTSLGANLSLTQQSLAHVAIPVCIAVGERDETVTAAEAAAVAAWMPNATFTVVPNAPHPIERVNTNAIMQLVRDIGALDAQKS